MQCIYAHVCKNMSAFVCLRPKTVLLLANLTPILNLRVCRNLFLGSLIEITILSAINQIVEAPTMNSSRYKKPLSSSYRVRLSEFLVGCVRLHRLKDPKHTKPQPG